MSQETELQKMLAKLREDYARQLPQKLEDLTRAVQGAISDPSTKEYARSLAHKLRGTAGSYSFSALSEAAGKLEDILRAPTFSNEAALDALRLCQESVSKNSSQ